MVWLNVQQTSLPENATDNTTVEGLGNLGFPVNDQMVIANTEWLKANPSARKFFEGLVIPIEDINAENLLVNEGEKSNEQIMQHAKDWIASHQDQWKAWIEAAKAAK